MSGYVKLFDSIFMSTVWQEDHPTRIVWITLLGRKDKYGVIEGSIPGLAHLARVTIAEAEAAISKFLAPDPHSKTPDHEGRRIEVVDGGWRVLNHEKYRDLLSTEDRREKDKVRQQRCRDRKQKPESYSQRDERDMSQPSRHTDTDSDSDLDSKADSKTKNKKPTPRGVKGLLAKYLGVTKRNLDRLGEVVDLEVARSGGDGEGIVAVRLLVAWQFYVERGPVGSFKYQSPIAFLESGSWAEYDKQASFFSPQLQVRALAIFKEELGE